MEEKLTFEGQPIAVFHDKEVATEAKEVQDETVKTLKRMIGGQIKPKYDLGKMKHGAVRYYSDEEVFTMNQKLAAQNIDFSVPATGKTAVKLERLLAYIGECILANGFFHVATHVSKCPDKFYDFMGHNVSRNGKVEYHRGMLYQDLKKLAKYKKIYSKGNSGTRQYFLVVPEEKMEQPQLPGIGKEVEVIPEQPGASMPDIVQRVVFDVVVNVKMNFSS
jgi:hypothetical protein